MSDSAVRKEFTPPLRTQSGNPRTGGGAFGPSATAWRPRNTTGAGVATGANLPPRPARPPPVAAPAGDEEVSSSEPASPSPEDTPHPKPPSPVPEDHTGEMPPGVYRPVRMEELRKTLDDNHMKRLLTHVVRELGSKLWPADGPRPDSAWSRDGLFSETTRRRPDRKLSNQVLGIMSRLTPENYSLLKEKLRDLPVRQSTEEEIREVVQIMYNKAVQPEDEIYANLYAQLMADLVAFTGREVGETIRRALVDQCQTRFEKPFQLSDEDRVDADGKPLPDAVIFEKESMLKKRLRANIKFLGHLFICGMVVEKVVTRVLFTLIYPSSADQKRKPQPYELEMFCDLLKKAVQKLSKKACDEYVTPFMSTVQQLQSSKSLPPRIKFMLMDLTDLYNNNWLDPRNRTSGPMKLTDLAKKEAEDARKEQRDLDRQLQNRSNPPPRRVAPVPESPTVASLPEKDEVYQVMEEYKNSGVQTDMVKFFKQLPADRRVEYLQHWVHRTITNTRREDERVKVGDVISTLMQASLLQPRDSHEVLLNIARKIVSEQLYDDMPKVFNSWASVIANGAAVVPMGLHTKLLRCMVESSTHPETPVDVIIRFLEAVHDTPRTVVQEKKPDLARRFRLLPTILMHAPKDRKPDDEEPEEEDEEDEDADKDLLDRLLEHNTLRSDPELSFFDALSSGTTSARLADMRNRDANRADQLFSLKVVCAVFTYCRCDVSMKEHERCRELLTAIVAKNEKTMEPAVLMEVFMTWRDHSRLPKQSLPIFVNFLRHQVGFSTRSIETFKNMISAQYTADVDSELLDAILPKDTKGDKR